jgi:hypothetical protein
MRCVRLRTILISALLGSALCITAQAPYGIHPRSSPQDYAVSQQTPSATFAASLVPHDEVKHLFAVDISSTYVVLEVACYPSTSASLPLSPDDFVIKAPTDSTAYTHPADAVTVAAVMQEKNAPRPPDRNATTVVTSAELGYESGTDPYTGRRVHGVYTGVGTGVAVGAPEPVPPGPPPSGSTPYDRMTLEQQLAQRALAAGSFSTPVAGFLYFPAKELKKKTGVYELEYLANGGTVHLRVPTKAR